MKEVNRFNSIVFSAILELQQVATIVTIYGSFQCKNTDIIHHIHNFPTRSTGTQVEYVAIRSKDPVEIVKIIRENSNPDVAFSFVLGNEMYNNFSDSLQNI